MAIYCIKKIFYTVKRIITLQFLRQGLMSVFVLLSINYGHPNSARRHRSAACGEQNTDGEWCRDPMQPETQLKYPG